MEEGGVAIRQQAGRVADKVRTVVEKDFGHAIGTRGKTILLDVLDQGRRVVTAFPVDRFFAIGLGAVAIDIFAEGTAAAAEEARARIEAYENRATNWGEVASELAIDIASLGLLASSTANEGEDFLLAMDRLIEETAQAAIAEIEAEEDIELTDEQRQAIHDLAAVAIGAPVEFEEAEEEVKQPAQPWVIRTPTAACPPLRPDESLSVPASRAEGAPEVRSSAIPVRSSALEMPLRIPRSSLHDWSCNLRPLYVS